MARCERTGALSLAGEDDPSSPKSRPSLIRLRCRAGVPASRRGGSRTSGLGRREQLQSRAPGRGEGGMDKTRPGPALRRHLAPRVPSARPADLYEKVFYARDDMENRIKECQSISMPIAPRPPPCGNQLRCGLPRWPMCCCAPCAASGCITHRSPSDPQTPLVFKLLQDRRPLASECPPHQGRDGVACPAAPCPGAALPPVSAAAANARASPA